MVKRQVDIFYPRKKEAVVIRKCFLLLSRTNESFLSLSLYLVCPCSNVNGMSLPFPSSPSSPPTIVIVIIVFIHQCPSTELICKSTVRPLEIFGSDRVEFGPLEGTAQKVNNSTAQYHCIAKM